MITASATPGTQIRPATAADVAGITRCVCAACLKYIERIGRQPWPMLQDYASVIRGFDSIYLMTNEKMTENQELYARIGYVASDRRTVEGYARVLMRKRLR